MKTLLVIAPHPDDEVLGAGGTIARYAASGAKVTVVTVTRGRPPQFDAALIELGRREAAEAHAVLGVHDSVYLDFPAAELDQVPHRDLNRALADVVAKAAPDAVFLPFVGDIHRDHQITFESAMVALRPNRSGAHPAIYAYETLSETNWNAPFLSAPFAPNAFIDISAHLDVKLRAMQSFASQLRPFPNERSIEAVTHLARLRGATVSRAAAEAFVLVRTVL